MSKIDTFLSYLYCSSISLLDVMVIGIIIPFWATTFSPWCWLLLIPWIPYSATQGLKYSKMRREQNPL